MGGKKSLEIMYFCFMFVIRMAACIEIPLSDIDSMFQLKNNAKVDENHWAKNSSFSHLSDLSPVIDVQSVLSDGIGWEGSLGFETAYQVIITVSGTAPETKAFIPFPELPVSVRLDGGHLRCILEDGRGDGQFSKCDLSPEPFVFKTNMLGRISFSIPIPGVYDKQGSLSALPALMIRSDFMPKRSWYNILLLTF